VFLNFGLFALQLWPVVFDILPVGWQVFHQTMPEFEPPEGLRFLFPVNGIKLIEN